MKLSVCIPYKARLDNLAIALEAQGRQTMPASDFEVIIGAMEYSTELIALCAGFRDRLNLVTACSSRELHIPRARNLAMRNATGDVIVQIDADTMLAPEALQRLYDHCFAFGQRVCAVGQVVGYDNNTGDIESVELRPYEEHLAALQSMASAPGWPTDPRFQVEHNIPYDLEWGYRVCASGMPIALRADVYGLHLPHPRNATANRLTGKANADRFLRKWPARDVELVHLAGDTRANELWPSYRASLARASDAAALGVAVGAADGGAALLIGVPLDDADKPVGPEHLACFDVQADVRILPLTGIALPFEPGEVASCRIGPRIRRLPATYRDAVLAEAERVSRRVIVDEDHGIADDGVIVDDDRS